MVSNEDGIPIIGEGTRSKHPYYHQSQWTWLLLSYIPHYTRCEQISNVHSLPLMAAAITSNVPLYLWTSARTSNLHPPEALKPVFVSFASVEDVCFGVRDALDGAPSYFRPAFLELLGGRTKDVRTF